MSGVLRSQTQEKHDAVALRGCAEEPLCLAVLPVVLLCLCRASGRDLLVCLLPEREPLCMPSRFHTPLYI